MIKNGGVLGTNKVRRDGLEIMEAGYRGIEIDRLVKEKVRVEKGHLLVNDSVYDLKKFNRVFLVGFGKGSALLAVAIADILDNRLSGGMALDIKKPELSIWEVKPDIKFLEGTHPMPSLQNVRAVKEIVDLLEKLTGNDLLLVLVTGGGSSLLCSSEEEFHEVVMVTDRLMKMGAPIDELNTVRKHLSTVKGGGLAKVAYPATVINLVACDVCCSLDMDLAVVASGPTMKDKTTKKEAEMILMKYGLNPHNFSLRETPKEDRYFEKIKTDLVACNQDALLAMLGKAKDIGYKARILTSAMGGPGNEGLWLMIDKIKPGEVIIAGGETTVKANSGRGGRNQEAVLGGLDRVERYYDWPVDSWALMSLASDGHDNGETAGAIGDGDTLKKARERGLKMKPYLDEHSSTSFFEKVGDLVYVEERAFNVADLSLVLRK